jgi:enamine deaminase RidA (YjgF/YER057c/UK114 family)
MDRTMNARRHQIVTADSLAPPVGYAHAVIAAPGRTVYLGGHTAQEADGVIRSRTIVEQFGVAADNMLAALRAAGGEAPDLVSLLIYSTDVVAYRAATNALADAWRTRFGRHYPAIALVGVNELFDPAALIELVGVAVVP